MDRLDDDELLALTPRRPEAFAVFYRRHEQALLGWLVRRTGDPELAADLSAETWAAALLSVRRFDARRGPAVPWTFGIAHHKLQRAYEKGWQIADTTLTPHLLDPREVLTVATFSLVRRPAGCGNLPNVAMGAGDALVTVQEYARVAPVAPRPARFVYHETSPAMTRIVQGCIPGASLGSARHLRRGRSRVHVGDRAGSRGDACRPPAGACRARPAACD
jgi:hypothetical protein